MITLRRLSIASYKGIQVLDLAFPERGSFLIEGRNEAGKSTLFDAIFFALYGTPLVGDQAAAIHYGSDELAVQLGLSVAGTQLDVQRRVRQTAKALRSEATLEIQRNGELEVIKGSSAVSQRLLQELGGLTSEALLNSCLVAQKQLGRLEMLTRASREQALSILLNLSKLSDIQERLALRPTDEAALARAQARVTLARVAQEEAALAARRAQLEREQRLLDLRDHVLRLHELQRALEEARATARACGRRLGEVRAGLAEAERIKAARARWQHVQELARLLAKERRDLAASQQQAEQARAAAAALPEARARLEQALIARACIEALAACQVRLRELAAEAEKIDRRLEERRAVEARRRQLEVELHELRGRRRRVAEELAKLAPLGGRLQLAKDRLAALNRLEAQADAIGRQRHQLEELEREAGEVAEAEARAAAAKQALDRARAQLVGHEERRRAVEARRRQLEARGALAAWLEADRERTAYEQARRLLDDLALGVAGVERIALVPPPIASGGPAASAVAPLETVEGLSLRLVIEHPLTGALLVDLRLAHGSAALAECRVATAAEQQELQAGTFPTLGRSGEGWEAQRAAYAAALEEAAAALRAAGERVPRSAAEARQRLAALEAALQAPLPEYDEQAHLQARAAVAAAEQRLAEASEALGGRQPSHQLASQLAEAQQQLAELEAASLELARSAGVPATTVDEIAAMLRVATAKAQEEAGALAGALGARPGLEAQLSDLDRNGQLRRHELDECLENLSRDCPDELARRRAQVDAERLEQEAAARRHLERLARMPAGTLRTAGITLPPPELLLEAPSGVGEEAFSRLDPAALRAPVQAAVDEAGQAVARLEQQTSALGAAERSLEAARQAVAAREEQLADALREAVPPCPPDEVVQQPAIALGEAAGGAAGRPPAGAERELSWALPLGAEGLPAAAEAGDGTAAPEPERLIERAGEIMSALDQALGALDEPALRAEDHDLVRRIGAAENEVERALHDAQREVLGAGAVATALGQPLPGLATGGVDGTTAEAAPAGDGAPARPAGCEPGSFAAEIEAAFGEALRALPARQAHEQALAELASEAARLMHDRRDAQLVLGDESPLSVEEAERALEALRLEQAARRKAVEIVAHTRRRMIDKVLPDTITNMCILLPLLTAGRYRHAKLTDDYRLQVWDERKRDYVEKSLYSGGTQDQFSLALRLGFALAALPRELGTSPGFLFLDEPLSSFDHDRTAALVELLTRGQIATFFRQVFLISHSRAFDPTLFTHHVVMEEGRVAFSTLPAATAMATGAAPAG